MGKEYKESTKVFQLGHSLKNKKKTKKKTALLEFFHQSGQVETKMLCSRSRIS